MRDGPFDVAVAALGEGAQPLDGGIARRQIGRPRQPRDRLRKLLLPEEQQPEVGPARGLVRHQLHEAVELLARVQILARLHGRERHVERGDRLAIGRVRHARPAAASRARDYSEEDRADDEEREGTNGPHGDRVYVTRIAAQSADRRQPLGAPARSTR